MSPAPGRRPPIFSFGVGHVPLFQPLFQVVGCCCCLGVCAVAQVRHLWAMPCVVGCTSFGGLSSTGDCFTCNSHDLVDAARWKVAHRKTEATPVGAAAVLPVVCPPWSLQWAPKRNGSCVRLGRHQSGTPALPSPRQHLPRLPAAARRLGRGRVHGTAATAWRRR